MMETAFPFECSNPNCNCTYDINGFIDVYHLWGYIFMTSGDKCLIGLTCPTCRHTSVKQFSVIPQDFNYKGFDTVSGNTPDPSEPLRYIKFSPDLIPEWQAPVLETETGQDDIYTVPGDFMCVTVPPELMDLEINISSHHIDSIIDIENTQNLKAFPRIIPFDSVYNRTELWLRNIASENEISRDDRAEYHFALETLFKTGYENKNTLASHPLNRYEDLIQNNLTAEEFNALLHGAQASNLPKLFNDYRELRARKDFELICYDELINKYARDFYYAPGLMEQEAQDYLEATSDWEDPNQDKEQFIFDEDGNALLPDPPQPIFQQPAPAQTPPNFIPPVVPSNSPTITGPHADIINRLNKEHAIVRQGGQTLVLNESYDSDLERPYISLSKKADFLEWYANKKIQDPENPKKKITEATFWWQHPARRTYNKIVFSPGGTPKDCYNLWKGFAVQEKQGDWSFFHDHIYNIISNQNDEIYQWIMGWMARIIQNPGGDLPGSAIVLRGGQGTGKTFFGEQFGSLFGQHYLYLADPAHFTGRFNLHQMQALFTFVDEGFLIDDKKSQGLIRSMITGKTKMIEQKFKDAIEVKNYTNLLVASNYEWIVPAGRDERRFCVIDLAEKQKQSKRCFNPICRTASKLA